MPSPLLAVNRQTRDDLCKILRKDCPVYLTVTGQGINVDSLGLSSFIAIQQCTFTGNVCRLQVEVWTSHPERPVETSYIWKSLRRLRDDFQACKQIRRIESQFRDNDQYPWRQDGILGNRLSTSKQTVAGPRDSDIHRMLSLFYLLANTSKAKTEFPARILDRQDHEDTVEYNMLEHRLVDVDLDADLCLIRPIAECLEEVMLLAEDILKYKIAALTEKRLNEITQFSRLGMSQADYLDFVKVWPHFETLSYPDFGHSFKDCSFHADIHGQEQADQDSRLLLQPMQGQKNALELWLGLKGNRQQ